MTERFGMLNIYKIFLAWKAMTDLSSCLGVQLLHVCSTWCAKTVELTQTPHILMRLSLHSTSPLAVWMKLSSLYVIDVNKNPNITKIPINVIPEIDMVKIWDKIKKGGSLNCYSVERLPVLWRSHLRIRHIQLRDFCYILPHLLAELDLVLLSQLLQKPASIQQP